MPVDDQIEECANNALVVRLLVNYQIRAFFRNPFYNYAAPFPHFLPLADVPDVYKRQLQTAPFGASTLETCVET